MRYRELLLGCGHKKDKRLVPEGAPREWQNVTTVDMNPACKPDVVADLESTWFTALAYGAVYDEIHAYEVLEHLGSQGDYKAFFNFFEVIWGLLKSDGFFCATVPSRFSGWLWGDPGHRRAILQETLVFLQQPQYTAQCGVTSMSDYRFVYTADFNVLYSHDDRSSHSFILQAVKPSRISV